MSTKKIVANNKDYTDSVSKAIKFFWNTKKRQLKESGDTSNRGSVVGGKQMDGFIDLLRKIAVDSGIPSKCIITKNNHLPGYFRSSKNWDMLIIAPTGKLIAVIELKSLVGSYGNNFNNRTEEAIGSAVDLWTAFREGQFPDQQAPWVGWLMVVGRDEVSERTVKNIEPHFSVRSEYHNTSYLDRCRLLCQKLILERHYTSAAIMWTSDVNTYGDLSADISIQSFINSFSGYLNGVKDEFK